jgi:hypothetical protein
MKKFNKYILAFLFAIPASNVYAACSGESCCTVSSGVISLSEGEGCNYEPDSYSIKMFKMHLCTSEPSAPTTSAATGYAAAGCELVIEASAGTSVTITPGGDTQTFTDATLYRPAEGAYTHGVVLIDNVFTIEMDKEFNATMTGADSSTGKYCATVTGSADETTGGATTCSTSDNLTAGSWGAILTSFDGLNQPLDVDVEETNLNGSGADIGGYLVTSSEVLAQSRGTVSDLIGIQTFATPVVVTKDFKGLNIAFGINQGSQVWDNSNDETIEVEVGSGPFQAIITPLNY